jgi:modulator of FtsH protease
MILVVVAMIASWFLPIPGLQIAISAGVVLLMSLMILFDTSRIINGGETNYVRATVSLYLDIYNLFIHLLHLVSVLTGDD